MPPFLPKTVESPKSRIKEVITVIDDGVGSSTGISVVELELKNGERPFGLRWNISNWSPDPDLGFPSSRGKPTWFIVGRDEIHNFLKAINAAAKFLEERKNTDKNSI